jgi:hypothetical protein
MRCKLYVTPCESVFTANYDLRTKNFELLLHPHFARYAVHFLQPRRLAAQSA